MFVFRCWISLDVGGQRGPADSADWLGPAVWHEVGQAIWRCSSRGACVGVTSRYIKAERSSSRRPSLLISTQFPPSLSLRRLTYTRQRPVPPREPTSCFHRLPVPAPRAQHPPCRPPQPPPQRPSPPTASCASSPTLTAAASLSKATMRSRSASWTRSASSWTRTTCPLGLPARSSVSRPRAPLPAPASPLANRPGTATADLGAPRCQATS